MRILDWLWDEPACKTRALVDTGEFYQWYWVSGYVPRAEMLLWVGPLAEKALAEVRPCRGQGATGSGASARATV